MYDDAVRLLAEHQATLVRRVLRIIVSRCDRSVICCPVVIESDGCLYVSAEPCQAYMAPSNHHDRAAAPHSVPPHMHYSKQSTYENMTNAMPLTLDLTQELCWGARDR